MEVTIERQSTTFKLFDLSCKRETVYNPLQPIEVSDCHLFVISCTYNWKNSQFTLFYIYLHCTTKHK